MPIPPPRTLVDRPMMARNLDRAGWLIDHLTGLGVATGAVNFTVYGWDEKITVQVYDREDDWLEHVALVDTIAAACGLRQPAASLYKGTVFYEATDDTWKVFTARDATEAELAADKPVEVRS